LHGEKSPGPVHRCDADRSEPRVKNILAVAGRIHPAVMNGLRIRTDGDVFGDEAEMRAGFRETPFEIGFAGKLVLEHIQIGHAKSVETRGFKE